MQLFGGNNRRPNFWTVISSVLAISLLWCWSLVLENCFV